MKRVLLLVLLLLGVVFAYHVLSTHGNASGGITVEEVRENLPNLNETLGPIVTVESASFMHPDKAFYSPNDTMILTITNKGNATITTGYAFRLYRLEDWGWREVPVNLTFAEVLVTIGPGKRWEQRIDLSKLSLTPGHYRIVKIVSVTAPVTKMSMGIEAWTEFNVR
ncbi:immunoglobulin-like domain-containing protein [Thermococcus gorgonarius]|uniref:Bacterial Ig-like domain-containing protein n=1 Tax=Thermococcus gorgonarius TaxID=71997 RepID=A0A2Z2MAC3_THEGO|nr:immunoglobulin-like domain-containing protein [Thermococcus gorgonarius]ASJ00854.1 hypothetical protein A3K92_04845 [Thermococcus gorgonarius]